MKKTIFITLLIIGFYGNGFAQIDDNLKSMQLYEGSVYVTYGHRITQLFSELEFHMGVGLFPKTNIAYLTYPQLIVLTQDTAKQENWNQTRYQASRNYFKKKAPGGRIILYVERFNEYETNTRLFFVIIRDKNENKLFEKQLPYRAPGLVSTSVFSNWAYVDVDVELPDEFFVYVNHKLTEHLSDTKFLVQKNSAPVNRSSTLD